MADVSKGLQVALDILDLVAAGATTAEQLAELRTKVEGMVAADRDPTDEEWEELFDDIDAKSAELHKAAED